MSPSREDDIVQCAKLLAEWRRRVLLLHGSTACGKSSFLRAGLIPYLDRVSAGIAFIRTAEADQAPVLFVRSTAEPLAQVADAICRFASREITLDTPDGPVTLVLREALPDHEDFDVTAFRRQLGENPEAVLAIFEKLSRLVPETLVLIIDQGEEVLTVDNSAEGERRRTLFFSFLSKFMQAEFDLKVIIALRTEYFGRFISRVRRSFRSASMAEFYLDELGKADVAEAMLRPTLATAAGSLGSPRDFYQFTFDEGVVDHIIRELGRVGAKLPDVQIVCTTLYDKARLRPQPWHITRDDLESTGGVEGSIERFLDQQLIKYATAAGLSPGACDQEVVRWKEALHDLARAQPDGTVTTDIKPESALRDAVKGSRLSFSDTAIALAADDVRLLRKVDVVDTRTGALVPCFGLGHDTLGLVLRNWKTRYDRERDLSAVMFFEEDVEVETVSTHNDVALCLSGAGYPAMLFNLGAVWRLNELGYLRQLAHVSGVSAGAIVAGLLGARWHDLKFDGNGTAKNLDKVIVDPIRALSGVVIDANMLFLLVKKTYGADTLVEKLKTNLFKNLTLQDLPDEPDFVISAINVQSCSLFRFSKSYLGDSRVGLIKSPSLPLAMAVAASAATPPVLSPIEIPFEEGDWSRKGNLGQSDPRYLTKVCLMEGTLYDHFGLEPAWKKHRRILISDGGGLLRGPDPEPNISSVMQLVRVVNLLDNQLHYLRRLQISEAFKSGQRQGTYWSIRGQLDSYGLAETMHVDPKRAAKLMEIPARFAKLSVETQDLLINWGYAICDTAIRKETGRPHPPAQFPYPCGV